MSPVYDYYCDCGLEWEEYNTVANRDNECCACGKNAKRHFKINSKPVIYEYYSDGLGAYITGPKQKRKVMKEKNVEEVGRVT